MKVLDVFGRRGALVVAGCLAVAAVGGTAIGVVASRGDGPSSALVPEYSDPVPPTETATPSASPTASPTPTATRSATPSPTPSPTARPTAQPTPPPATTPPPPAPTPSPTRAVVVTTPPPAPAKDMAVVLIDNTSTVGAKVTMNGSTWTVPAGTKKTVEVKPEGAGHDSIAVSDMENAGCGMGDSDWFFEAGKTYTLSVKPSKNCIQGGKNVDSLTWSISPKANPGG